jgi:DNA repair protein RadD
LQAVGLRVGILQSDCTCLHPDDEVIVASIQTIRRRNAPIADFVVIDEANILHKAHIKLMETWNALPFVGLSATPLRHDLGRYFESLIRGPSVRELTDAGYLVPAKAFCPSSEALEKILSGLHTRAGDYVDAELSKAINRKELVGDIVKTWKEKASDRRTLCFAVDIAHSKSIVDSFKGEGVRAEHLDAYTDGDARVELIQGFRDGEIQILSSVNVLGIGFDVPDASCGILARPTLSEALDMQQKGRLLRPAENKSDALLLDHAGNTLRFGLPIDFTVPELNSDDRLATKAKRKQRKMIPCTSCGFALEPDQMVCPSCGIERPGRFSKVSYVDSELIEYGSENDGQPRFTREEKRNWFLAFVWYGTRHSFKNPKGWAYYAYVEKFREKSPWDWRDLTPVMPTEEQARWIKHYLIKSRKRYEKEKARRKQRACPVCGSEHIVITTGKGPHVAGKRCADCNKFICWLPKAELDNVRAVNP